MISEAEAQRLIEQAEARVRELSIARGRRIPFLDFQPMFVPGCERRPDLAPVFDVFERAYQASRGNGRPIIALISAPPQVGKTLAGQASFGAWLARSPSDWLAYVTYQQPLAETKSRDIRDIALRAGVDVRTDSSAVNRWQTTSGGGLLARGITAGLTGQSGLAAIWVDDPYASRAEAESEAISASINETISGVVMTRRHPRTSVIVSHTRWTTSDLIASLEQRLRGRIEALGVDLVIVNLPCVDLDGEPLITFGGRDRSFYEAQRLVTSEHDWWSLYMGAPRPREGKLFRGTHVYTERPGRYSTAIGMDLAYSAKKSSDWSVAVVLGRELDAPPGQRPRFFVLEVVRRRCSVAEWVEEMRALRSRYLGAELRMRTGGQEAALLDTIQAAHRLFVQHEPTRGDKLQNALTLSDDWNAGRVLVPASASWDVSGFLSRMLDFSGQGASEVDDEVDALVTAHRALVEGGGWALSEGGPVGVPAGREAASRGGWL